MYGESCSSKNIVNFTKKSLLMLCLILQNKCVVQQLEFKAQVFIIVFYAPVDTLVSAAGTRQFRV